MQKAIIVCAPHTIVAFCIHILEQVSAIIAFWDP